jgi:fermentation-respiration switch protein FrsA (DUF1100 family)
MSRKLARKALLVMVAGFALCALAAQGIVNSMLYHPAHGSRRNSEGAFKISVTADIEINALYLPNPAAKFTLWYFHGNAEALGDIEPRLREFHARGFAVFAYDYPGYGLSNGQPSERAIYAANAAAQRHLVGTLNVPLARVVLYGRSLGGGPAVDLARRERVAGLVLENAFTSVFRVVTRWPFLPGDQFKNAKKIPAVSCPIFVMHSRDDQVIPFHHGATLYQRAAEPKRSWWVERAGHNNLREVAGETYWRELTAFVTELN